MVKESVPVEKGIAFFHFSYPLCEAERVVRLSAILFVVKLDISMAPCIAGFTALILNTFKSFFILFNYKRIKKFENAAYKSHL
jgi:hypothetical protein